MTTVLSFGSFDGFHKGHKYYLSEAKKLGDTLVVIVARDKTITKVKGHQPKNSQAKRLAMVKDYHDVDDANLGYEENYFQVLDDVKPDIIALGYDQQTFKVDLRKELKKIGLVTKIVRLKSFHPEKYKSSKLGENN